MQMSVPFAQPVHSKDELGHVSLLNFLVLWVTSWAPWITTFCLRWLLSVGSSERPGPLPPALLLSPGLHLLSSSAGQLQPILQTSAQPRLCPRASPLPAGVLHARL